ncbi:ATP-binding protein [Granulicella tundricola]|uniref:AAA ATPase central domain protein n=1 Tax=Granulicella tundricola (strain ATCC BAA-1859 / DSM 23138 / MP5ACTX9) TaxID=1198114 RepID=E8X5E6_GRATM|nr:AAA family ATPase [Granulicella tundricola]ADW69493.1 AAA ATPase central domain protein [Granulicella tundricola MP5ACTX9]
MSAAATAVMPDRALDAGEVLLIALEDVAALLRGRSQGLDRLIKAFDLSPFETSVVLLGAALELKPEVAKICAALHDDARMRYPSLRLALQHLPEAQWEAVAPGATLRHWKLIEVAAQDALLAAPFTLEEPVLHYLLGTPTLDGRIAPYLEPMPLPASLPASFGVAARDMIQALQAEKPVLLRGSGHTCKAEVAAAASAHNGMRVFRLQLPASLQSAELLDPLIRLLSREAMLHRFVLLLDQDTHPLGEAALQTLVRRYALPLVLASATQAPEGIAWKEISIDLPDAEERAALWVHALGDEISLLLGGEVQRIAGRFPFEPARIAAIAKKVREGSTDEPEAASLMTKLLWRLCREDTRLPGDGLIRQMATSATWADIVLPEASMAALRDIAAQARHQQSVMKVWGLGTRGAGIAVLFHGQSGTGKTLAAEVLAHELHLDLWVIDLSQVVSKYIGETEKNLSSVFDAAEQAGALLLFDEADALFGKRSEIRDSHDRYANIEVGYLLQRMEQYSGLAVLTTNLRGSLDTAFLRRLRFVVPFPFPDQTQRRRIWEGAFPPAVPCADLDYDKLARLNMAGGNIRNIALSAAYLAAEAQLPLGMEHLRLAAQRECAKFDRGMTEAELGGWR